MTSLARSAAGGGVSGGDFFRLCLRRLQQSLAADQLVLITRPADIRYLSGFTFLVPEEREAVLAVSANRAQLWSTQFSPPPRLRELEAQSGCRPTDIERHLSALVAELLPTERGADTTAPKSDGGSDGKSDGGSDDRPNEVTILIDQATLKVAELRAIERVVRRLADQLGNTGQTVQLTAQPDDFVSRWRLIKDRTELEVMRRAARLTSQALHTVSRQLRAGQTEIEVKRQLDRLLENLGGDDATGPAFPTIVAFGSHGALPHHQPDTTLLEPNTPVLIDCGMSLQGYKADMTRSWWFGDHHRQPQQYQRARQAVDRAYQAAVSALKPPLPRGKEVDAAARDAIAAAGFGDAFIHTTGHGLGLEVHEPPSLGGQPNLQLELGMVVTIEPGIYLEGKFGIRHENTVALTENGPQELTEV
ncbi:MAG: hypothetical protein COU69_00710 [Candidatus Pacebacteria bacterium CG10_big_fil_rev_8_21_14_0_10_56_10]|nr:MAG: hypothetical protein COU69_00710 [Candidatus Pacebacteria bacterium CG10_big_fil_rev_8_21_14_0_10_56_10]